MKINIKYNIFLILITLLHFPLVYSQSKPVVSSLPYQVGERLTYNVSFANFSTAAHIELLVLERGIFFNREGIKLQAQIETTGMARATLLSLNNRYISYIDPNTQLPFYTEQLIDQDGSSLGSTNTYNQTDLPPVKVPNNALLGIFDALSAIYKLRQLPLTNGLTYSLNIQQNKIQYKVEAKVIGNESIRTSAGYYETSIIELKVLNSSELNNYNLRINFSNDKEHLPVLIRADHPNGEIRAELASASQHPGILPMNRGEHEESTITSLPFPFGEQLNYKIYLGNPQRQVGIATLQVKKQAIYFGRDGIQFTYTSQTKDQTIKLFGTNEQINTYVNPTSLLPFKIEIGSDITLTLDQNNEKALTNSNQTIKIPNGTHDLISIIYALRCVDLKPPRKKVVPIFLKDRLYQVFFTSIGKDILNIGGQRIPTLKVEVAVDYQQNNSITLWFGTDHRRLPIRFSTETPQGLLQADLAIMPVSEH
jgi:hypothetical protein